MLRMTHLHRYEVGARGVVIGKQTMSSLVICCGELDQDIRGRRAILGPHLCKTNPVLFAAFTDVSTSDRCALEAVGLSKEFQLLDPFGGLGWAKCRIRPHDLSRL